MAGKLASRREEAPTVAAVVVHYGQPEPTIACLTDLAALEYPALTVVVVDNDPARTLAVRVAKCWPSWEVLATGENQGYCRAVNQGVEKALARDVDYLLLLNNDTRFGPDFLRPLVEALEADAGAGSAGPRLVDTTGRIWCAGGVFRFGPNVTWLRGHGAVGDDLYPTPAVVDYFPGACVLHRASALREVGGVDESYWMYMEDLDLALKLRARGYKTIYVPWSRVVHDPSLATGGGVSPRRKYFTALNSVHFLRRHGTLGRWLNFWLCDVLALPLAGAIWLLKGKGLAPASAKARGIWHGLLGRRAGREGLL